MSRFDDQDPQCNIHDDRGVALSIIPRTSDIGNFEVHRALPSRQQRMVGPFIFWDQMGPGEFLTGQGLDVRPHPHIGLSTITYLFDGEIMHRDSLGVKQRITPGDINLMTAGSGIVHSERTDFAIRNQQNRLFGIQSWLALPKDQEERAPAFKHIPKDQLPFFNEDGMSARLICGSYKGESAPTQPFYECIYMDIHLDDGAKFHIPCDYEERALYALSGQMKIDDIDYPAGELLVLHPGHELTIQAIDKVRVMLLGGAPMDGPRHIWWNFVSSSKDRIEQAKRDWKDNKFANVPNEDEFIPLPED